MTTAYIGMGSNLDAPVRQLEQAVNTLSAWPGIESIRVSPAYWSQPWGVTDQPEFLNAVAEVQSVLEPAPLLDGLLEIERGQGRERRREIRWGPRRLDLDLLVYGNLQCREPDLTVPHPRLTERPFVYVPLADLAPGLIIPGRGPLAGFVQSGDRAGLRRAAIDLNRSGSANCPAGCTQ